MWRFIDQSEGLGELPRGLLETDSLFFFQNKDMGASKKANANIKAVGFAAAVAG